MTTCPRCGTQLLPQARFCTACGYDIAAAAAPAAPATVAGAQLPSQQPAGPAQQGWQAPPVSAPIAAEAPTVYNYSPLQRTMSGGGGGWLAAPLLIFKSARAIMGFVSLIVLILFFVLAVHFVHAINGSNRYVAVESDMQSVANAEVSYRTTHPTYTDSKTDLYSSGYQPASQSVDEILLAGANGGTSYCVIGAENATATSWYLFNSSQESPTSFNPYTTYATMTEAEAACPLAYQQVNGPALATGGVAPAP